MSLCIWENLFSFKIHLITLDATPQAFNDKSKRATLFVDFLKNAEDWDKLVMLHKRRCIQQRIAENTFRPKTYDELMQKFNNNEQYVQKVMDEAVKNKRFQKDKFMPNDTTKNRQGCGFRRIV